MSNVQNGNLIIKNAHQVVTCSGYTAKSGTQMSDIHIIDDGAVVIEEGVIRAVGKSPEILKKQRENRYRIIDARGKAVIPGFIDPHTHLVFAGDRSEEFASRLHGKSYMEILEHGGGIISTVRATREASKESLIDAARGRLDRMLSYGVTTVEAKSGYGLDLDSEIKQLEVIKHLDRAHPVDVIPTYLGAHVVPEEFKNRTDDYVDFIIESVLPVIVERGLAEFCDVFCEEGVFSIEQSRRILQSAQKLGLKAKLHADEIVGLGGAELAAELDAVSADHLLSASDRGLADLAAKGVIATLLPGTAFCLRRPYARARNMIDSGLSVALATDLNPGTFFSESIPLVFALAVLCMGMSISEAVTAITINAAAAIGKADTLGSIDVGKQGDVVILEVPSYTHIPYHTGVNVVEKVIKRGVLVYETVHTVRS